MTTPRHIAVIDIGKTNAKLALLDLATLSEIAVVTRPNKVVPGPPWAHFDTEGHWDFILHALKRFHGAHRVDAISVTTHGASVVLLDKAGKLAAPILDYEHPIPAELVTEYDKIRPPFSQNGSPRLANGLNVGAQIHYQFAQDPTLRDRTDVIMGYPQYWGFRLTGEIAYDVTSIGCHTDLWNPKAAAFSDLVHKLDIEDKIAPVCRSDEVLGTLSPAIADQTGLPKNTPVSVGIHDSNASLYPHILGQKTPFSVVSTGTWVIAMAVGGDPSELDPHRDTLVNVNAFGDPVPSARFMGGREYEMLQAGQSGTPTPDDIESVLSSSLMLLPAVATTTGPFQGRQMLWTPSEPEIGGGQRAAAISYYLAMMTATCLSLIGAEGSTIVEGPFATDPLYKAMLLAATGRPIRYSETATGTALGAALLLGQLETTLQAAPEFNEAVRPEHRAYALAWRAAIEARS